MGHGTPISVDGSDYAKGRVYQLYGSVKTPFGPGYDALVGEPGEKAYWWHVNEIPSPGYIGFVQELKPAEPPLGKKQ